MATDDDGLTLFDIPYAASPFKDDDDESSVDIYDGLDSTAVVSDNPAEKLTPTRNCLNLYDEILIEEGAAKEATYNDLKAEYEKCQQQIKELVKKFKEIQAQNSILQNENQALKKNISALIKTARVEINRKDEEISNLHQRLSEFPNHRNNYARMYHPGSTNTRCSEMHKTKDPKFRASLVDNSKADHRLKTDCSKDVHHSYSSHNMEDEKSYSERKKSPYLLRYPPEELCNDSSHTCFSNFDHYSNKGNRREREMKSGEQYNRTNDNRYKRDAYQSTGTKTDSEQGNTDSHQKLQIYSEKSGKSELQQESKSKKLKCSPSVENRTDRCISAREKHTAIKERSQIVESHDDEKGERSQNINKQDLEIHDKDERNYTLKNKSTEKQQEQPRKSGRVNSPHSKNEIVRSPHKSHKCPVEVCRRGTDGDCKKVRGANDHSSRETRCSPSTSSNREHKHTRSKESSSRYERETTYSKSEKHRTEEKRKRDKENREESKHPKNERKVTKEIIHQTSKESKKDTDDTKNERNASSTSEETSRIADGLKEHKARKAKDDKNVTEKRDLKLSFMEKLNLTLSPAKTQPLCQNNGLETDSKKAISEVSAETPGHTEMLTPSQPISTGSVEQTNSPLQIPVQTNLESKTLVSEIIIKDRNEALPETLDIMQPEDLAEVVDALQPDLTNDNIVSLPEASKEMEDAGKTYTAPELASPMNHDEAQNIDYDDLETISSDDFESQSVADEIRQMKSDSLMQVVDTNDVASGEIFEYPAKKNSILETSPIKEDVATSEPTDRDIPADEGIPVVDQNTCNLETSLPEPEISIVTSFQGDEIDHRTKTKGTNPVPADDDNSILSIDLNHLRYIPKIISPLNSPMRPLAKTLRMESPCKVLVKSYNKDLTPESTVACPSKTLSNEVNKENQKPVCSPDKQLKMESQLSLSSDELEEGEIVSDDEKSKSERNSENSKISRGRASDTHNLSSSPHNQMTKTASCNEDSGKLVYAKVSENKSREKHKTGTTKSKERKKNKTMSIACLEKIVQIILEPSTVQEIMQMLKAIRKQIRKNYMKFKMHFPVQHFHRIIESAILNFTSLIKYLDFSKMSKVDETLKCTLCETIESKLRHVKKNATVEQLFEQQLSDMKKKLWKFVDEQLDYLFEKIKRILVKLCDLVSMGTESDEGKLEVITTQNQKCITGHKTDIQKSKKKSLKVKSQKSEEYALPKPVISYQSINNCHHDKNKTDAPKNVITKCLNSIDNTRNSQTKVLPSKDNNLQGTLTPLKSARYEKDSFHMVRDTHKSDFNYELLTEQQTSSLTFNLVSDAQMGEIFRSLLQGSDLLEKSISSIDTDQWEFRTPEKQIIESQKCRNNPALVIEEGVPTEACVKSIPVETINWPLISPERASSLSSRLQMPVDPDILDESCMFEVPPSAASNKDDECSLQKNKSFVSSILLEDLAVSLTIPSPLKSDAHLSFLKPENTSSSTPEGVLSAHYSEDALLEEEDATEQDIHLALESDNSSSRSSCSSWTSRPIVPGFPCDPSLPMQAVIMEKSNDHFIVKIRRAVPSTSPTLDQTLLAEESLVSLTKKEEEEIISAKIKDNQGTIHATVEKSSERDMDIDESTDELHNVTAKQEQAHDLPDSLKEPHSAIGKDKVPHSPKPFSETSNQNGHGSENINKDFKLPQLHELKVPENKREIPNTSVESPVKAEVAFPSESSVDAYIDLTEDIANDNEVDLCNLAVESTLKVTDQEIHAGNLDKEGTKEETLECSVNAYIDLTEELTSEIKADESNFKTKTTLNVDLGCQTSLDKNSKKRKKDPVTDNSKTKRQKKETELAREKNDKSSKKFEERGLAPKRFSSKKSELPENKDPSTSSTLPRSLYAKNIIKKKGEVVVSWTRNDDREILLECQKNGPSGKTFVSLAARLNKNPNQVSERFKQLMKLFKKSKCK